MSDDVLDDDDMTTTPGAGGGDVGGGDADGTDGGDADGTDGDGTDGDATDSDRRRRRRRGRHRRRRDRHHRRRRLLSALEQLTGDAQTFREKVWASRVHHHRVDPAELAAYLSLEDADRLLTATAIRTPSVRLVARRHGAAREGLHPRRHPRRPAADRAGRRTHGASRSSGDGATVVFQGLHRSFPPLVDLIAELELELGHPCQANAYLTPPGVAGLRGALRHPRRVRAADRRHQAVGAAPARGGRGAAARAGPRRCTCPTGTPHAARAQDTVSLHITIGINQLTWRGLVERALALAGRRGPRRPPAGRLPRGPAGARPPARPAPLGHRRPAARRRPGRRGRAGGTPVPHLAAAAARGRAGRRARSSTRSTTTPCCGAGPGHPCVLVEQGERLEVLLGDRTLDVPARIRPALEEVRGRDRAAPPRPAPRRAEPAGAGPAAGPGRAAQGRPRRP